MVLWDLMGVTLWGYQIVIQYNLYNDKTPSLIMNYGIIIKGLDEGSCSFADYLVTSVHLRGSPENVLFPESILKNIPETRRATDGKSEEVVS